MIPFRKSIGFRLLVISFILLAFPLLVDSFILVQQRYEHAIQDAKGYLSETAHLRELPLSKIQPVNKPLVELLVRYFNLDTDFPQNPNKKLNKKLSEIAQVGEFYSIFLIKVTEDQKYIVVGSGKEDYLGKDYTNFFKLKNLYSTQTFARGYESYITYDSKTLQPFFMVSHPVYSHEEGKIVGVLIITDDITKKIKELLKPDKHEYQVNFALLLPSSVVFAATDPDLRFQYFLPLEPEYRDLFLSEEGMAAQQLPKAPIAVDDKMGFPFFEFRWKGKDQIGYLSTLPDANYALLTYASKEAIIEAPFVDFFNIYIVYGLILLIGGCIATLLTMRMAKPIRSLSLVMHKIQQGQLDVRYKRDLLGFEINLLGHTFNEMVDAVLEQKQVAEKERVKREIFAQELRLGREVQRNLLPQSMPAYPGVELAELYIPAIEVGGDFFDVFVKNKNGSSKLVLAVADASGKGVQACFYSLNVRNIFRTYARECEEIGEALSNTNNLFRDDTGETGMFVTALAGFYDYRTKILDYYSCGHNPGLVKRVDGSVEVLSHLGVAMGFVPYEHVQSHRIQLQQGDIVVFYTDGITEAHNMDYAFYGEQRLIDCLRREESQSSSQVIKNIVESVNQFVGDAPQHDDITLLVMTVKE